MLILISIWIAHCRLSSSVQPEICLSVLIEFDFDYKKNLTGQESEEVEPRLSSIRDTSFSWESLDSQVGSRQSLLDNKGRCRLLKVCPPQVSECQGSSWPLASQPVWRGNAGGEDQDMDLTRRQREQRKKDIREKVRFAPLIYRIFHLDVVILLSLFDLGALGQNAPCKGHFLAWLFLYGIWAPIAYR